MDFLERNLLALERIQPELAKRLCQPLSTEHIHDYGDGRVDYKWHQSTLAIDLPESDIPQLPPDICPDDEVLLFGVGLGEQLQVLLNNPAGPRLIHAWEDDPWLLRATLTHQDLRAQIFAGRVIFYLGVDLSFKRSDLRSIKRVSHPIFKHVYTNFTKFLEDETGGPICLMCSGDLFVEDCSDELRARGFQIYPWNTDRLSREELEHIIEVLSPKLLFAINYRLGLQDIARIHNVPVVCWEIDPSLDAAPIANASTDSLYIFSYREINVQEFTQKGFANVTFMPLAASTTRRHPLREPKGSGSPYQTQISFVGASMYQQGQKRLEDFKKIYEECVKETVRTKLLPVEQRLKLIIEEQRKSPTQYQIERLLTAHFPEFTKALQQSDNKLLPAQLIAEVCAAHKRFDYLNALKSYSPAVWGDDGWEHADGISYQGLAGHHQEITLIYSNAGINIDIGRIYQSDIITMRVFDVLACEGFLLTERNPAIEELFTPGHDLDVYTGPDELADKVSYYFANPDRAAAIGKRGRQSIENSHTFTHRMSTIFSAIGYGS